MTMHTRGTSNQAPRWDNELIIRYMKDRLQQEDGSTCAYEEEVVAPTKPTVIGPRPPQETDIHILLSNLFHKFDLEEAETQKAYTMLRDLTSEDEDEASQHPEYKILRSLPGYAVGDQLRKEDKVLCYCKDATSFAMDKLKPNDCAFVKRSDGSYSYALYEGRAKRDPSSLSFQIDNEGRFKRVSMSKFCKLVKVPVLLGQTSTAAPATAHNAGTNLHHLGRRASTGQAVATSASPQVSNHTRHLHQRRRASTNASRRSHSCRVLDNRLHSSMISYQP